MVISDSKMVLEEDFDGGSLSYPPSFWAQRDFYMDEDARSSPVPPNRIQYARVAFEATRPTITRLQGQQATLPRSTQVNMNLDSLFFLCFNHLTQHDAHDIFDSYLDQPSHSSRCTRDLRFPAGSRCPACSPVSISGTAWCDDKARRK